MSELDEEPLARLTRVFRRDASWVFSMLRHRFGIEPDDAEDVTQEVFLVLRSRLADVTPGEERKFLFRTAAYLAANARRSAKRRAVPADDVTHLREPVAPSNAEKELEERDELGVLKEILDAMPDDLRDVFVFFEIEELTLVEIAEILPIPLGTVKSRLIRARTVFEREAKRRGVALGRST